MNQITLLTGYIITFSVRALVQDLACFGSFPLLLRSRFLEENTPLILQGEVYLSQQQFGGSEDLLPVAVNVVTVKDHILTGRYLHESRHLD